MKVKMTKISNGHYKVDRDDGYSIEVRKSSKGYWYQTSNFSKRKTLGQFKYDMENGYMAKDLLNKKGEK